jgi:hypothetical protein
MTDQNSNHFRNMAREYSTSKLWAQTDIMAHQLNLKSESSIVFVITEFVLQKQEFENSQNYIAVNCITLQYVWGRISVLQFLVISRHHIQNDLMC